MKTNQKNKIDSYYVMNLKLYLVFVIKKIKINQVHLSFVLMVNNVMVANLKTSASLNLRTDDTC